MSGFVQNVLPTAITASELAADLVFLSPVRYYRAIGPEAPGGSFPGLVFQADVTEEEEHRDQLFITEHPVEVGASVSDHAYKRPSEVQMRISWSNSSHGDPFFVQSIYDSLLRLQSDRIPFNLYTGKRVYFNMLLGVLGVKTDPENEFSLRVEANMHQIFLVQTQQFSISTDPNNLANPSTALPVQNMGSKVVQPPSNLNMNGTLFNSGGPLSSLSGNSSIGQLPVASPQVGSGFSNPGNIGSLTSTQGY